MKIKQVDTSPPRRNFTHSNFLRGGMQEVSVMKIAGLSDIFCDVDGVLFRLCHAKRNHKKKQLKNKSYVIKTLRQ